MKWRGRRGSRNIVDRRGRRSTGGISGRGVGGIGAVILVLAGLFFGVDVTPLLQGGGGGGDNTSVQSGTISKADQEAGQFVSVVLADTEEIWTSIFRDQLGRTYQPPKLVLFSGVTQSPCGNASGATGPFYCPADEFAYLDTQFFTTMVRQMGAKGDFAAAYVVAHEVAHHVQNKLGILGEVNQLRARSSTTIANRLSVKIELQADCLSGVWARAAAAKFGSLERGDVEEAINAARQIGDDTLQRNAGRVPAPHTFTHGTSEQRTRWFETGFETGDLQACDTFGAAKL